MRRWIYPLTLILFVGIILERSLYEIQNEELKLKAQKEEIVQLKARALARKKSLELQIMSQSDPRWITLTLIRVLGVVPEGKTKYYFKT